MGLQSGIRIGPIVNLKAPVIMEQNLHAVDLPSRLGAGKSSLVLGLCGMFERKIPKCLEESQCLKGKSLRFLEYSKLPSYSDHAEWIVRNDTVQSEGVIFSVFVVENSLA